MEEVNKKTKKIKNQDNKKAKKEKIEKKGGERKSDEKKSAKKVALIVLIVLVILGGGGFALKTVLTKTTVTAETVKMPDDARGFSNYFKEYLLSRVRAERLFSYSFRDLSDDEILNELTELKDGFSKVSRGVNSAYKNSEYRELAGVMESDSAIYLTAVRELRTVMTDGAYGNEGDRQLAFMRKVEETTKELRSALYIAREAFDGDVSGLSSKGVLLFNGVALVEVGGGVMNILVGDASEPVTTISTDDIDEGTVKPIEASGLYGYVGSRIVRIGDGFETVLENGWVKDVKAEVKTSEVTFTTTKVSLVMKNVWSLDTELYGQGIKGLVNQEKHSVSEGLNEVMKGLEGKN